MNNKQIEDLVNLIFDTDMEEVMKEKSTLEYIHKLQQENKQLKEENARLSLKPLEGIFAQVDDDMLLRSCGAMQQEVDNYKSILTELEQLLEKELDIIKNDEFFCNLSNKDYIEFILDKIQELKEKYK